MSKSIITPILLIIIIILAIVNISTTRNCFLDLSNHISFRKSQIVHDTTKIQVHDTIYQEVVKNNYITAISTTTLFYKPDTLETHTGNTPIRMDFPDDFMEFENAISYQILCNGKLYDNDNTDTRECAGEWVIVIKEKQ